MAARFAIMALQAVTLFLFLAEVVFFGVAYIPQP